MRVSYHNYRRMNEFLKEDIRKELQELLALDSDKELFGYQYRNERAIGRYLGKGYARGLSSGTTALQFALTGLGVGPGDEVITVPNTYIATALAISNVGATPVFVDVRGDTLLMDLGKLEDRITDKTKAVLPVHLHGQMVDMPRLSKIARKHGLKIIEDAAHAHLARYRKRLPGSQSDAACYSFYLNKALGGISNGGMLLSRHRSLHRKVETLRNPESDDPLLLKSLRTPAFLNWEQTAFLKCRMRYLKDWTERRRALARLYREQLRNSPVTMQAEDKNAYHVYRDFVIRVEGRDNLRRRLGREGITTAVHYGVPLHLSGTYTYLSYRRGHFPESERSCAATLSLPINPFLSEEEVIHVARTVKKLVRKR